MAGQIRLFEKTADGLLMQIAPEQAEAARKAGTFSRMSLEIDVLWTAEEEAARSAEEAVAIAAEAQRSKEVTAKAERRTAVEAKLKAIDISPEDLKSLLS